jgi:hypothetical protein
MAIHFSTLVEGDLMQVTTRGFDESLAQVQDYGMALVDRCQANGVRHVLCDERALEYRLTTCDTYKLAEFLAARIPLVARVAIVCNPKFAVDARFFEDVASNRGLSVRMFTDIGPARAWLGHTEPLALADGA